MILTIEIGFTQGLEAFAEPKRFTVSIQANDIGIDGFFQVAPSYTRGEYHFSGSKYCFEFPSEFCQAVPGEYRATDVVFLGTGFAALAFFHSEHYVRTYQYLRQSA
jgi:hypothetical protein